MELKTAMGTQNLRRQEVQKNFSKKDLTSCSGRVIITTKAMYGCSRTQNKEAFLCKVF